MATAFTSTSGTSITLDDVEVDFSAVPIGRGSSAVVYEGEWYGSPVAVKVFQQALTDISAGELTATRCHLESHCERLRQLRHPHIVQFLGVCPSPYHDVYPALVIERMDATLASRCRQEPPLTQVQELRLLCDVAAGLWYLHEENIFHRSLTTRSVFVTITCRAKLSDIGIDAILVGSKPLHTALSPGTFLYMSPEVLKAQPIYSSSYYEQADIFSFGILMTAMVNRHEPAASLLVDGGFDLLADGTRKPVSEIRRRHIDLSEVGKEHVLYSTILRCLQDLPERRPAASELFRDLVTFLGSAEINTRDLCDIQDACRPCKERCQKITTTQTQIGRLQRDNNFQVRKYLTEQRNDLIQQHATAQEELQELLAQHAPSALETETVRQETIRTQQRNQELKQQLADAEIHLRNLQRERDGKIAQRQSYEDVIRGNVHGEETKDEIDVVDVSDGDRLKRQGDVAKFTTSALHHQGMITRIKNLLGAEDCRPFVNNWRSCESPVSSTSSALLAAVHRNFLYLMARDEDGTGKLFRATDELRWEPIVLQENVRYCFELLSHQDRLYCVAKPTIHAEICLFELEFNKTGSCPMSWKQLVNGKCPNRGVFATVFALDNSILLVGCWEDGTSLRPYILEYNIKSGNWTHDRWLQLQLPDTVVESRAVVTQDQVLLVGGMQMGYTDGVKGLHAYSKVLSLDLSDLKPISAWQVTSIPPLPFPCCGATQLLGNVIVAGGGTRSGMPHRQDARRECYALDEVGEQWLRLPALQIGRCMPVLVPFRGQLVAIGGSSLDGGWLTSIEIWKAI